MANADNAMLTVEVAYALPGRQKILSLQVKPGCTAFEAAELSGITRDFPDLDLSTADMGVFAKNLDGKALPTPQEYELKEMDRVEIYRPLQADPKVVRQKRAAKAKVEAKAKAGAEAEQAGSGDADS